MRELVKLLEDRFYNIAYGDEKLYILNLLSLYYPILQAELKKTSEIKESKMNYYKLKEDCLHRELRKETTHSYLYTCVECGKSIIK